MSTLASESIQDYAQTFSDFPSSCLIADRLITIRSFSLATNEPITSAALHSFCSDADMELPYHKFLCFHQETPGNWYLYSALRVHSDRKLIAKRIAGPSNGQKLDPFGEVFLKRTGEDQPIVSLERLAFNTRRPIKGEDTSTITIGRLRARNVPEVLRCIRKAIRNLYTSTRESIIFVRADLRNTLKKYYVQLGYRDIGITYFAHGDDGKSYEHDVMHLNLSQSMVDIRDSAKFLSGIYMDEFGGWVTDQVDQTGL